MDAKEIIAPSVCIIAMKSQREAKEIMPGMHLPYYQVTIDPRQCSGKDNGYSPSMEYIRFGHAKGDELNGWIPAHEVEICEVIAEVEHDAEVYPQESIEPVRTLTIGDKSHKVESIDSLLKIVDGLAGIEMNKEQGA